MSRLKAVPQTSTMPPPSSPHSIQSQQASGQYVGTGYTITIPKDLVFNGLEHLGPTTYASWNTADMSETIDIEFEPYTSGSDIVGAEAATLAAYSKTPAAVSHPPIKGAASSTMLQTPLYANGQSAAWLWVIGTNGDIYSVSGVAHSPAKQSSTRQIIDSLSLMSL
jgi:hypothetical protein